MDEIKMAYKDNYPCIYEGMNNYLSVFSLKRKKYFIIFAILSALILLIFNYPSIINENDKILMIIQSITIILLFIESVLLYYAVVKYHLRQVASAQFISQKEQQKEIILNSDGIVFLRDYCKSNYYYDEFDLVIEDKKSISFVVDKNCYPVIISKTPENQNLTSRISLILKEKIGDRYVNRTREGRK